MLSAQHLQQAQDGVFILNVGHVAEEIDVGFLKGLSHHEPMPYVNAYQLNEKTVICWPTVRCSNLTAGYGDSLNAFDVTLAVMAGRHRPYRRRGGAANAGLYLLPQSARQPAL